MVVEYCETKDSAGYYRKYSAFRIDDQIIPGHLIFNDEWLVKDGRPPFEESHVLEKEKYLEENPHKEKILEIFNLAGVSYGRIDYSMLNGSIQTWEINTNPVLNKPRKEIMEKQKELLPAKEKLAIKIEDALMAVNYGGEVSEIQKTEHKIPLKWHHHRNM